MLFQFVEFFEKKPKDKIENEVVKAVQKIKANANWYKNSIQPIQTWFDGLDLTDLIGNIF